VHVAQAFQSGRTVPDDGWGDNRHKFEFQMKQTRQQSDGFPLAVLVEGGIALFAVFLGWLLNVSIRERFPSAALPLAVAIGRGIVATLPMLVLFWVLVHSPRPALRHLRQQVEWLIREMFPTGNYAQFGLVALLAGVGEELLFRGVLQSKLGEWTTPVAGMIIASVVFGLAHALSKLYFVLATLIGLYFGSLVLYFGELVTPIIAHALYDFVALAYLSKSSFVRTPGDSVEESVDPYRSSHDE
jgi:membrane protease YdiL (CAAX protease family)